MVLDKQSWAKGCLLTLKDEAALAGFDHLEGYNPEGPPEENDYERPWIEVFSLEGDSLGQAWAYVMSEERIEEHRGKRVENGEWVSPPKPGSASPWS